MMQSDDRLYSKLQRPENQTALGILINLIDILLNTRKLNCCKTIL